MRSDIVSVEVINNFSQQLASVTSPKYSQESSAPHTIEVKTPLTIDAQRYGTLIVRADDSDLNDSTPTDGLTFKRIDIAVTAPDGQVYNFSAYRGSY